MQGTAVRWLVRNNPGMLEAGMGNPFTFGLGSAVPANEMVPLPVRFLGSLLATTSSRARRRVARRAAKKT